MHLAFRCYDLHMFDKVSSDSKLLFVIYNHCLSLTFWYFKHSSHARAGFTPNLKVTVILLLFLSSPHCAHCVPQANTCATIKMKVYLSSRTRDRWERARPLHGTIPIPIMQKQNSHPPTHPQTLCIKTKDPVEGYDWDTTRSSRLGQSIWILTSRDQIYSVGGTLRLERLVPGTHACA